MVIDTIQLPAIPVLKHDVLAQKFAAEDNYQKWRPKFHVMPVKGWMNDPCAPGYDKVSGLYTLNFQWNPKAAVWGNMSWCSATSKDLVTWTIASKPSMQPDAQDPCGVFTGSLMPDSMDAVYTSAHRLPIGYQLPYDRGSERLHHASSSDAGRTWQKKGVVLSEPPDGLDVTGWRDPFVGSWSEMDRVRGEKSWYGMLSGGIRSKTPTVFLYRVSSSNPCEWTFLSTLVDLGLRFQPSRWTGNYGVNWEVASTVTLKDQHNFSRDIIVLGAQGTVQDNVIDKVQLSTNNKSMWMAGSMEPGTKLQWQYGGTFDHGCYYAASGFQDPVAQRFVIFGWIFEEDLPQATVDQQGWSGCLSVPRILSLRRYQNVTALHSDINDITCFERLSSSKTGSDVRVLQIMPDPRLQQLRRARLPMIFAEPQSQLECRLAFVMRDFTDDYGFELQHSATEKTTVTFHARTETVTIDRSQSTTHPDIITISRTAPHTLFRNKDLGEVEAVEFTIYYDTSVLEIFVNDRTVISTRIYPDSGACTAVKIVPEKAVVPQCNIWRLAGSVSWS